MKKVENYRPAFIDFKAESNEVPKYLNDGKIFENAEAAHKFINEHFVASSTKFQAVREMDGYEIDQLRHKYQVELEEEYPKLMEILGEAEIELDAAKEKAKLAKEAVTASLNKVKSLSEEVREGVTEMNLDQAFTYELVYNNKRYYYTIVDKKIQLCGVRDIYDYEVKDLISSSERNAESFAKMKEAVNG